jgi:hypothetical protein
MRNLCVKGCCVRKILVSEQGDNWVIINRPEFKALDDFTRGEPGNEDILITPGINPHDPTDIRPTKIVLPKKYGSLQDVVRDIIPNIQKKEEDCPVCKKAKEILAAN